MCASNNRRDRRRAAGGERDFTQNNGTSSESNSVCLMNENSSNYNSVQNSTEDSPSRGAGVDIRNWLFIEQNVGDILVRVPSLPACHEPEVTMIVRMIVMMMMTMMMIISIIVMIMVVVVI